MKIPIKKPTPKRMPMSKWVINYKGEVGIYYAKLSDLLLPSAYIEPILVTDLTRVAKHYGIEVPK